MKGVGLDQILRDLKDKDPEIKRMAAQAVLKQSPSPDDVFFSVLQDADRSTAFAIYDALFESPQDFSSIFKQATDDPDPRVRSQAIRYLFRRGSFRVEDGIKWLKDDDPYVRRRVLSYLSWSNDRSAIKLVAKLAAEDPDPLVRKDALRLIAVWGTREDAGIIIETLKDEDFEVKAQAIYTLKKITGEDFGEPIGVSEDQLEWIVARWQGWWEITKENI